QRAQGSGDLIEAASVQVGQKVGAEVPAKLPRKNEREEEHALELAQRKPEVESRRLLYRGEVDEDGPPVDKLDVIRARILEAAARLRQPPLEIQGTRPRIREHRHRPLIGVSDLRNRVVLEKTAVAGVLVPQRRNK